MRMAGSKVPGTRTHKRLWPVKSLVDGCGHGSVLDLEGLERICRPLTQEPMRYGLIRAKVPRKLGHDARVPREALKEHGREFHKVQRAARAGDVVVVWTREHGVHCVAHLVEQRLDARR